MEKMIKVINDNLRTVINGIKTHKSATENSLETVKTKMDERIKLAGEYRLNVEDARLIISTLENEISTLENDLEELKNKFSSKDFKEILVVGSKEINNKIIEKKSLIAEQSHKIIALTDKAHRLKTELISLKERKLALESTLEKDCVLEAYYESKILDIIEFSEEHVADLADHIAVGPHETLLTSTSEVENIDITSVIDGSVFEEIEEISNSTGEADELSIYLNDVLEEGTLELDDLNIEDYNDEYEDDEDDDDADDDAFLTREIDDIISEANSLLEISKTIEANIAESLGDQAIAEDESEDEIDLKIEESNYGETLDLNEVNDVSTPIMPSALVEEPYEPNDETNEITLSINDEDEESEIDDVVVPIISDEIMDVEPYLPAGIDDEEESQEIPPTEIGSIGELRPATSEDTNEEIHIPETFEVSEETSESDIIDEENMFEALAEFGTANDDANEVFVDEDPLQRTSEFTVNQDLVPEIEMPTEGALDIPVYDIDKVNNSKDDLINEMTEANLDVNNFSEEVLNAISQTYTKNNISNIVNTMRKHNIAVAKLYDSANILANTSAEQLDYVLSLLERTNASSDAISFVLDCLDKVDIYKLEEKLSLRTDYELTELLYDVIPYQEANLEEVLGINHSELNTLKGTASNEEYEMFNLFSTLVRANYNELKRYNVRNLNECITKHPHRFLLNPDNFAAILDKYDPDDLTRCVNKNSAVIDKL